MKKVYQTDDKQVFESEQEAILHEAVKSIEGIYIEEYKMKHLVKGLAAKLFVTPLVRTEEIVKEVKEQK